MYVSHNTNEVFSIVQWYRTTGIFFQPRSFKESLQKIEKYLKMLLAALSYAHLRFETKLSYENWAAYGVLRFNLKTLITPITLRLAISDWWIFFVHLHGNSGLVRVCKNLVCCTKMATN